MADSATYTGQQSGLYNDQLAPIFSGFQFSPPSTLQPVVGMGAGPNTLGSYGGSAPSSGTSSTPGTATAALASPGTSSGAFLGVPSVLWWIVGAFLVGYILLWKVHWR